MSLKYLCLSKKACGALQKSTRVLKSNRQTELIRISVHFLGQILQGSLQTHPSAIQPQPYLLLFTARHYFFYSTPKSSIVAWIFNMS